MGRTNKTDAASSKKNNNKVITGRAGKKSANLGGKAPRAGYGGKAPRKGPAPVPVEAKQRKPHRWRNGTVALREIRAMQKSPDLLLRRNPFIRCVRALAREFDPDVRFRAGALALLQVALENELTGTFTTSQMATLHRKCITLEGRDIRLARGITAMAPGKPLTQAPIVDGPFAVASFPVRASAKPKPKKATTTAENAEGAQNDAEAESNEPRTEEAAINPLVQAVAQEMTVRDEAEAPAPGTPKERRAPSTPTKDKKKQPKAPVNQFNDDDMAIFS